MSIGLLRLGLVNRGANRVIRGFKFLILHLTSSHAEGQEGWREEISLIQGKEQQLDLAGAAVKGYPTPKVRETQVRWEVLQEDIRGQKH